MHSAEFGAGLAMGAIVKLLWGLIVLGAIALPAGASPLGDRLAAYPDWTTLPPVQPAQGDLIYPDWMAGTWAVNSPLVEAIAPFAPEIVTPGFEQNRQAIDQPVRFRVRFQPQILTTFPLNLAPQVVADRTFNGREIAIAYLGPAAAPQVRTDPHNPNRQTTTFRDGSQLINTVTARRQEPPTPDQFLTCEVTNQVLRRSGQVYVNRVETTTAYHHESRDRITAEQVTAIYLSPQDPDYFQAGDRPVTLYRYRLTLERFNG
ncbi:DUF6816 family protein [Spirulina major]|uniref:DUF6816 family protein n=1 Tax=Spirulina major TaxID=270636 RepID=UPI000B3100B6|nr:hypothetical protein [Spirulina major]